MMFVWYVDEEESDVIQQNSTVKVTKESQSPGNLGNCVQ